VITHHDPLPDGRFNIVLRGLQKFRILDEDESRVYRVARIESVDETTRRSDLEQIAAARKRLEAMLVPQPRGRGASQAPSSAMADEDLVNTLAQYMELEPLEKQALLEREGTLARCRSLIELLEMKLLVEKHQWRGRH
jgi:Lon protease-like protein